MTDNIMLNKEINAKVSELFKVISDPTRINILYILKNKRLSVTEIANLMKMTQSAISHQLKILKIANLVMSTKEGKEVYYEMKDMHVYEIFNQAVEHVKEEV